MKKVENLNNEETQELNIPVVRQRALNWWRNLPMYNMDKPCKRVLAARHYQTEQSFLSDEQIEFIWRQEHVA
jgi:hypothetical protein